MERKRIHIQSGVIDWTLSRIALRLHPGYESTHAARKNSRNNFAVTSGFSSVRKCPESTGAPLTFVAHFFHVSSGVVAAVATPASPHSASIGIVIFLPASKSALSIS